jgi:hypothetical protein
VRLEAGPLARVAVGALLKGVGSKVLSSVGEDTNTVADDASSHLNVEGMTYNFTLQTVVASMHVGCHIRLMVGAPP